MLEMPFLISYISLSNIHFSFCHCIMASYLSCASSDVSNAKNVQNHSYSPLLFLCIHIYFDALETKPDHFCTSFVFIIQIWLMGSFDSDDYSLDSLTSDESNESEFSFYSDELSDDLQKFQISDEFSNEDQMEMDSMCESHTGHCGFISISPSDTAPIAVFRSFFTEEILNLIVKQTNI